MKRPDIDGLYEAVKNHCGVAPYKKIWCEQFDCETVLELINYIKYLETKTGAVVPNLYNQNEGE